MSTFTIKIRENGSLGISPEDAANLQLLDHNGVPLPLPAGKGISLCRCGASKRKPFCDASHKLIGFDGTLAPSVAAVPAAPAVEATPPVDAAPTTATGEALPSA